ncbi:methionyl-tRNA formyltransferase, partial [Streptomyces scabiei]
RGTSPDPGAWALYRDARLKVLDTRIVDGPELAPGDLLVEKRRVLVGTGEGSRELVTAQPQGKKAMGGADWGRGGVQSGEVL